MPEIETISWRELTGNKYNKTLHPAMLSDRGYTKQTGIRKIGDIEKTVFNVVYDGEYVIEYLEKMVLLKLRTVDLEELIEVWLIALKNVHKDVSNKAITIAFHEVTNT